MSKKIAIIMDVNPLEYCGGAERWAMSLARRLSKNNIDVSIFVPSSENKTYKKESIKMKLKIYGLRSLYKALKLSSMGHIPIDLHVSANLKKIIKNEKFDTIILNNLSVMITDLIKKYNKYSQVIGIIHDFFPICPLRDLMCNYKVDSLKKGPGGLECIKCLIKNNKFLYNYDLFLYRKNILNKLRQHDKIVLVSNAQKSLINIYNNLFYDIYKKKIILTSGPILDPRVEEYLSIHGIPSVKKSLAIAHIGGLKIDRGFDKFVSFINQLSKHISPAEVHIHGKMEEKQIEESLKTLYKIAREKGFTVHAGYVKYGKLLSEINSKACVVVSASRAPEAAPLYVLESFALGSLVLAQRRLYGPYELVLKILRNINFKMLNEYVQLADLFTKLIKDYNVDTKKISKLFNHIISEFFETKTFLAASRRAIDLSNKNFQIIYKII